jgi:signal transduction histidine kinase
VEIYNTLSWEYKNSQLDSAMYFARMAELEAKKLTTEKDRALSAAYNSIASVQEALGQMDSAEYYHLASLSIKKAIGDSIGMAASFNNLGIVYDLTDRNEESVEMYLQALKIYEANANDPFQIAMVQGNIGIVLKKLEEFNQALSYYMDALKIYREQGSEFGMTVTNGNIGSLLVNLGRYEESISFSQKAESGYEALGYKRYMPYASHNRAIALDSLGQYAKAEEVYLEAIKSHGEFENSMELASSQNALARMYNKMKKFGESKRMALSSIENARKVKSSEFELKATKTLAIAEMGLSNFQRASELLTAYIIGKDSLYLAEKTAKIVELQTKYETEKKERLILVQEAQIAEKELTNQRNQILLASSGGIIGLLIIIGLLGRNRLKWKNRQLLEEQRRLAREAEMNAVITSQERERNRFARDLHDGFGQLISTLNLNLKNLESPKNKEDRERVFHSSAKILEEMYQELKNVCFDLMPQTLVKHGLEPAINEFANRLNQAGKHYVEVNIFGLTDRLTDLHEISLYRITQEWVNNVIKYSNAARITIQITKDKEEITLLIEDNGMGFDKTILTEGKGNGWRNMNSRCNLIHGDLELDTTPGLKGNTLIMNALLINEPEPSFSLT